MDYAVIFIYIIIVLAVSCIFGIITKSINESKGYNGGFAWGFWLGCVGIIVVACRQSNLKSAAQPTVINEKDELAKFKKMFEDGIITEQEYQEKRKKILGL